MSKGFPNIPWVRYADDGALNCSTIYQAKYIIKVLKERFKLFGLELNLDKTKIVYCKDSRRKRQYECITFDFLGYTFRPRCAKDKNGRKFTSFLPAISEKAKKAIRKEVKSWKIQYKTSLSIKEIADMYNSKIQGWINYYTHYYKTEIKGTLQYINFCIIKWVRHKYKKIGTVKKARIWLRKMYEENPKMFAQWKFGIVTAR